MQVISGALKPHGPYFPPCRQKHPSHVRPNKVLQKLAALKEEYEFEVVSGGNSGYAQG